VWRNKRAPLSACSKRDSPSRLGGKSRDGTFLRRYSLSALALFDLLNMPKQTYLVLMTRFYKNPQMANRKSFYGTVPAAPMGRIFTNIYLLFGGCH